MLQSSYSTSCRIQVYNINLCASRKQNFHTILHVLVGRTMSNKTQRIFLDNHFASIMCLFQLMQPVDIGKDGFLIILLPSMLSVFLTIVIVTIFIIILFFFFFIINVIIITNFLFFQFIIIDYETT